MALKQIVRNGKIIKKIVRKKQSSSDQPLTKRQELNNHIVCMRNTVNQARVQIINRLVQQVRKYKKRKGNEDEKQKANRKADRLVEEIQALKKLKKDKASLYALLNTQKLEDVLGNPSASSEEKAVSRLSHHPLIQNDVKKYRNANPNWDVQISVLLEMTKQKKPKKDEPTTSPNNVIADGASTVKSTQEIKSEVDVDVTIKTEPHSESESNESSDDSDEAGETPVKREVVKSKPTKQTLNASIVGSGSKKLISLKEPTVPLCDKSAGAVKVKFLKNLAELEDSTESLAGPSEPLHVDITKAPVIKRPKSAFFVGGVDEPNEEPPKDFQEKPTFTRNPNTPSKPVFRKGKLVSKPPPRQHQSSNFNQQRQVPPPKFGRPDNRFSGNSEPLEQNPKRSKFSNDSDRILLQKPDTQQQHQESTEKLHPSWEAKKKQQQISLTAFKGKKITFGDDD